MKILIEIPDKVIRERGAENFARSAEHGTRRQGGVQGLLKAQVASTSDESLTIEVIELYKP